MTPNDPNIEVSLTDDKTLHCFKVIYHIQIENQPERAPLEIYLHATQAFDLFHKLGAVLLEYFAQSSSELLRKVFENHEARDLLTETKNAIQECVVKNKGWEAIPHLAVKIDGFLAVTQALNHPKPIHWNDTRPK